MATHSALRTLLVVHAALASACADRVIGENDGIRHDDFVYAVTHVERADRIGALRARGAFYIVTFSVTNHARRVQHGWHNNTAYVVDEHGAAYENDPAAQRALERARPFGLEARYLTPAGITDSTKLVFDLPRDVRKPYLKVRGDLLMGDVFDLNRYQRTRVRLF